MNFSTRGIINEIYNDSQDFRKRKFDIQKYQSVIEKIEPEELMSIAFKEFPGNFARKFLLVTLKWWKTFDKQIFIKTLNKIYDDELTVVYFVSFCKRYFDLDLTNLCIDKQLYLKPVDYFKNHKEWIFELQRLSVDVDFVEKLKDKL